MTAYGHRLGIQAKPIQNPYGLYLSPYGLILEPLRVMIKETKDNRISFRLTDSEYEPFRVIMDELGLKKSDFFRLLVTDNLDPEKHNKKNKSDYGRLLFLFNKTSNNLNQVAKKLNTLFKSGEIKESDLKKWFFVLNKISKNLSEGLDHVK